MKLYREIVDQRRSLRAIRISFDLRTCVHFLISSENFADPTRPPGQGGIDGLSGPLSISPTSGPGGRTGLAMEPER
jgi:hypothetical protein